MTPKISLFAMSHILNNFSHVCSIALETARSSLASPLKEICVGMHTIGDKINEMKTLIVGHLHPTLMHFSVQNLHLLVLIIGILERIHA